MGRQGTARHLEAGGVKGERVLKIQEGRPNASDLLKNGEIQMMLLTTKGGHPRSAPLSVSPRLAAASYIINLDISRVAHSCEPDMHSSVAGCRLVNGVL